MQLELALALLPWVADCIAGIDLDSEAGRLGGQHGGSDSVSGYGQIAKGSRRAIT